jgi:hypothetical protein
MKFLMSIQAWIEASTKGGVLLFTASEIETASTAMGINPAAAGLLGGMGGGIAQAYATMGQSDPTNCVAFAISIYTVCPRIYDQYENGRNHAS